MHPRRYVIPEMNMGQAAAPAPPPPTTPGDSFAPNQAPPPPYPQHSSSEPVFPWANPALLSPAAPANIVAFPPYFRTVSSIFPSTPECCQQCNIPFGVIVSPAAVSAAPLIDYYAKSSVPRCTNCSGYICPQSKIMMTNNQPSWSCALCGKTNAFTNTNVYNNFNYQNLVELSNTVYDIVAPEAYARAPSQSSFMFIIDMSYNAFAIGFTQQILSSIKASVDSIPQHSRIGIMAMSNTISVFDLKNERELVLPDLNDTYLNVNQENVMPVLSECKSQFVDVLDLLLSRVPTAAVGHCILSAMNIAEKIMTSVGGIIIAGFVKLPTSGPYALKPRSAEQELELLRLPKDGSGKSYREAAFRLNRVSVSVHVFCASDDFCDLSTIAIPAGLTCGECNFYSNFDEFQRARLHADLFATLTNDYCWDSSLRLRCSPGIKLIRPHTNCVLKAGDLISFPVIAKEDSIVFELTVEKPILQSQAIFQLAFVYTTTFGQRMIRVFTFTSPISGDPNAVCSAIDEASLISIITRRAMTGLLSNGPVEASATIRKDLTQMYSRGTRFTSIVYFMHSLLNNLVMRPIHPLGVDGRMATIIKLRAISMIDLLIYFYPRMFAIDISNTPLPLCSTSFSPGNCFVFHTVDRIYLWVSKGATPQYLMAAFGVDSVEALPVEVPSINSPENGAIQQLLTDCWTLSGRYLPSEVIGQGNSRENIFSEILVDDLNISGANLQKLIQELSFISR